MEDIVIKPEGDPSAVNLEGKGLISVAILSTATFDATDIDPETLLLGDEAGTDTLVAHCPCMVDCMGEAPQRCMLVRGSPEEEWRQFYDRIEGFEHEEGFRYRLLEVLSKEREGES